MLYIQLLGEEEDNFPKENKNGKNLIAKKWSPHLWFHLRKI